MSDPTTQLLEMAVRNLYRHSELNPLCDTFTRKVRVSNIEYVVRLSVAKIERAEND